MVHTHNEWSQVSDQETAKIPLVFYATAAGNEPVRNWLKTLERAERLEIGADLERLQYRWPVGMPLCRPLGEGLWEVRSSLPSKTISRVFICFHQGVLYALHGFVKKTQKSPADELEMARKRKREVENA